jgi:hypothetical protein
MAVEPKLFLHWQLLFLIESYAMKVICMSNLTSAAQYSRAIGFTSAETGKSYLNPNNTIQGNVYVGV